MQASRLTAPFRSRPITAIILNCVCIALLATQLVLCFRNVVSSSVINDDYRQNLFWVPSLASPDLFTKDLLADYARSFNPPGVRVLYGLALGMGLTGPVFSKILSYALFLLFLAGAACLGRAVGGRNARILVPLLVTLILLNNKYYFRACMGGLSRNFAFPLQVWMVWALYTRNRPVALMITLISSLLHPQTFLLCLVMLLAWEGIEAARHIAKRRPLRPLLSRFAVILFAAGVSAVPVATHALSMTSRFGPVVTSSDIGKMDEFEPGGRWWREKPFGLTLSIVEELRADDQLHRRGHFVFDLRTGMAIVLCASFVFWSLYLFRHERRRFWRWGPVLVALSCGLLVFIAGDLLLARLYFPNRFLRPLIPLIVTTLLAERIAMGMPASLRRGGRLAWAGWVGLVIVGTTRFFSAEQDIGYPVDASEMMPAAAHVRTLPPDSLLAAFPKEDADNLSTFGEHSLFIQREVSHPLYRGFLAEVRRRTYVCLTALFPVRGDSDVVPLAREGVDYVLVNKEMLSAFARDGKTPDYDEPYGSWLARRLESADRESILKHWTVRMRPFVVYEDPRYLLVDITHLQGAAVAAQTLSSPIRLQ